MREIYTKVTQSCILVTQITQFYYLVVAVTLITTTSGQRRPVINQLVCNNRTMCRTKRSGSFITFNQAYSV